MEMSRIMRGKMELQMFSNLFNNAANYVDEGGQICLAVRQQDDQALVSVRNRRVGIAPIAATRLLEMLTQADCSKRQARGGLARMVKSWPSTLNPRSFHAYRRSLNPNGKRWWMLMAPQTMGARSKYDRRPALRG
jgi:hypothetical protein